jgi:hypothetical protein
MSVDRATLASAWLTHTLQDAATQEAATNQNNSIGAESIPSHTAPLSPSASWTGFLMKATEHTNWLPVRRSR